MAVWLAQPAAAAPQIAAAAAPPPGTARMALRLQQIVRSANPTEDSFLNRERAAALRRRMAAGPDEESRLRPFLISELVNAGETVQAIQELEIIRRQLQEGKIEFDAYNESRYRHLLALAYLRLGEQENCLTNHTTESCLYPIQPRGWHRLERGSREAIAVLGEILAKNPSDLKARWLLNLAYMTVGDYPDHVPGPYLIPLRAFESEYRMERFQDVAGGLGLDVPGLAGGSVVDDFDNDGYLDVLASEWDLRSQIRYFRNNRDGTFHERTSQSGLEGVTGGLNMVQADYDNDGWVDVFLLRGAWRGAAGRHPNSLLRNLGGGRFEDVTEEAGLLSFHPTQTAVWLDFDNDGWLDLFVGNESFKDERHPCELFRNNGNGTFTECAAQAGVANVGFVKAVAAGDYNNDGRIDLYLSRRGEPNVLYRNEGPSDGKGDATGRGAPVVWTFRDVSIDAGVTQPAYSFPAWFWDYDNDGWLDLFVAGYSIESVGDMAAECLGQHHRAERARLFHNRQDGTFEDVTHAARLDKIIYAMGCNFGDLDNDGWLDFYAGTGDPELSVLLPNRMFRNADGRFFQEVTTSGGFGHLQKGHGISFADLDNDGDQDIYHVVGGAYAGDSYRNVLFENPGPSGHWLTLKLEGVRSNRSAIGARIKAVVQTPTSSRTIYKTLGSGGSFGASPLRQEIGLGEATRLERVDVFWPATGRVQVLAGMEMDHFYQIREDAQEASVWPLKKLKFVLVPDKFCGPFQPVH